VGHAFSTIDELGDGYGFRKVREPLGVTAFGVNAMVIPPGKRGVHHYHDEQDELYFVHQGTARFDVDGDIRELGPGGFCHVESTSPRVVENIGDEDLILVIVGGKGGYVGRDGNLVDMADLEHRQAISRGEFT
jgi:mannose-6-phosphate isomerase-like protein (cupin superfamily)